MEHHVFAVWDFMSLLKALQIELTRTTLPWVPVGDPEIRYLINDIVLEEESDIDSFGKRQSHYEMYLKAMEKSGAKLSSIDHFIRQIEHGTDVYLVIATSEIPASIKEFLAFSFDIVLSQKPHQIAAAFTFGRENLIPGMFHSIVQSIQKNFPKEDLTLFQYYFNRHIELDQDGHAPMALKMLESLCGKNVEKWQEAEKISRKALEKRLVLWDGIETEIDQAIA